MRELQRQRRFQRFERAFQFFLAHQEAKILPVTRAGKQQHFHVGPRHRVQRPRHHLHAVQLRAARFKRHQGHVPHRRHRPRAAGHVGNRRRNSCPGLLRCKTVLAPHRNLFFHQRRQRPRMQNFGPVVRQLRRLRVGDLRQHLCIRHQPRVGAHDPIHVRPDPQLRRVQRRRQNRRREIRSAPPQRGRPPVGCR